MDIESKKTNILEAATLIFAASLLVQILTGPKYVTNYPDKN